jgi:hypothetical protein
MKDTTEEGKDRSERVSLNKNGPRMRRAGWLAVSILTPLVAGSALLALSLASGAGENVPFQGSDSGSFVINSEACSEGLQIVVSGAGTATHLGKYVYSSTECFNPSNGAVTDGVFELAAASGDAVTGTFSGHAVPTQQPNIVTFQHSAQISGGTGRFASGDGELVFMGEADLATGEYSQTISGRISSPGSAE